MLKLYIKITTNVLRQHPVITDQAAVKFGRNQQTYSNTNTDFMASKQRITFFAITTWMICSKLMREAGFSGATHKQTTG